VLGIPAKSERLQPFVLVFRLDAGRYFRCYLGRPLPRALPRELPRALSRATATSGTTSGATSGTTSSATSGATSSATSGITSGASSGATAGATLGASSSATLGLNARLFSVLRLDRPVCSLPAILCIWPGLQPVSHSRLQRHAAQCSAPCNADLRCLFTTGIGSRNGCLKTLWTCYVLPWMLPRAELVWLPRRAGSSGISWGIHFLVKKTLHRHRAAFEPQRASSFMKRVKASQILGEAVRA
jgi:hypothetical protein